MYYKPKVYTEVNLVMSYYSSKLDHQKIFFFFFVWFEFVPHWIQTATLNLSEQLGLRAGYTSQVPPVTR